MSDSNKFVNTYIEVAVGTVHDYTNQILQLKTQLKIANDLVSEKDQVISTLENEKEQTISALQNEREQTVSSLQQELEREKAFHSELDTARSNAAQWENEVNSLRNTVANFDVLTSQYNTLKQTIIERDQENESLKVENEELKSKIKELLKYEKLAKKEEKKSPVSPAIAVPKKDINKEINQNTKPLSMPVPKPVSVTNNVDETDDF